MAAQWDLQKHLTDMEMRLTAQIVQTQNLVNQHAIDLTNHKVEDANRFGAVEDSTKWLKKIMVIAATTLGSLMVALAAVLATHLLSGKP